MLRVLAVAHVVGGLLLTLAFVMFGSVVVPVTQFFRLPLVLLPLAGAAVFVIMGAGLWQPTRALAARLRRVRVIAVCSLVLGVALCAVGVAWREADQTRAATGGGLLGGLWVYPLGVGVLLALTAAASFVLARRIERKPQGTV
jgi:hypothetical protein